MTCSGGVLPCDSAGDRALPSEWSARFCFLVWVCVEYFPVARQDGVPVTGVSGGQYPFEPLVTVCRSGVVSGVYISHIAAFLVRPFVGFMVEFLGVYLVLFFWKVCGSVGIRS